ncbi:hypothetical protein CHUAL_013749 [Chamberlinius hualienensis]
MVNCCVPYCKSESGKKNTLSVSFHDFPLASETLSMQWINNISRQDWKPSDTSKVCSLHFLPTDYKCGGKLKRLLPNAVPSVFPQQVTNSHTVLNIEAGNDKKRTQPASAIIPYATEKHDDNNVNSNESHLKYKKIKLAKETEDMPMNNDINIGIDITCNSSEGTEDKNVIDTNESNSKFPVTQLLVLKLNESPGLRCLGLEMDAEVKLGMEHIKEINAYKAKLRRRDEKIRKLENEITILKRKMDVSFMEEKFLKDFANVFKSAKEGSVKALFILQQIKSFSHKAAHWDERILNELVKWRQASLRGYEKAKATLLVLPHRTTLTACIAAAKSKDISHTDGENSISSLASSVAKPNSFVEEMFDQRLPVNNLHESLSRTLSTDNSLVNMVDNNLTAAALTDDPIAENAFKDLVDNPLTSLSENAFEHITESTFKNSFEEITEHPFESTLDALTETAFDKLLVNKLDNKLEHILSRTLDDTLSNTLDKFIENKPENKINCFESQLDTESLESILDNTSENTLDQACQTRGPF